MPGRVSARSNRSSAAPTTRKTTPAVEIPDEGETSSLRTQICQVFKDAQRTTATQRKLAINLRKIQEACCFVAPAGKKKRADEEDFDENEFNDEVVRCVVRVLNVKKGEPVGDRIIRFLGVFLKYATDKDNLHTEGEEEVYDETPSSRLMCRIVETVLRGFDVKDKTVRFRATQTVALLVNSVEQLDNELYGQITLGLLKRLRDKEPFVRVQAVLGLGRLANEDEEDEDEDSDDETAGNILVKLLDIMQNDPSAEVRRAVLMNLPFTPKTIKYLLERARDLDPITRRTLYGKLLPVLGDFRHLSLVEREKLLRWGLRDRDEMVRKATARLFSERWIEHCALSRNPIPEEERKPGEPSPPDMEALTELLERIDVARSGVEDGVAHQAMREFWELRPDYREDVHFDDDFWNQLTPEAAFVVRSFNDFCLNDEAHRYTDLLEKKLPEIMRFAKFIEIHLNRLLEDSRRFATLDPESEEALELDEECDAQVFVVEQLLYIALTLDYTDEVGRRMVNTMMQDALSRAELPESCTKLAVEVLRTVCSRGAAGEKEFINLITTALGEIKDTLNAGNEVEESFHSARSDASDETMTNDNVDKRTLVAEESVPSSKESAEERKLREWFVNQKCLHIAECMLQNVHLSKLEGEDTNQDLNSILNRLIIPAVQDKHTEIREAGLRCMGLSCLLSENLAMSNMELFLFCFKRGFQSLALEILTDVIITHPSVIAPKPADADTSADPEAPPSLKPNALLKPIMKAFLKAFESDNLDVSQVACIGASKFLLMNILPSASAAELLKAFTLRYFNPETAANPALRQSLSYVLPVFCHSRQQNARLMAQIAVPVIQKLQFMREEVAADEELDDMVGWPVVAGHLAEWTDGRQVVGATELGLDGKMSNVEGAEDAHLLLAIDVLERALQHRDERKPLLTLLGKLYISSSPSKGETGDEERLRTLHALAAEAVEGNIGTDATSRNFLVKLEAALSKRIGDLKISTKVEDGGKEETDVETANEAEADDADVPDSKPASRGTTVETDAELEEEEEDDGLEEDTMLAGVHAEGTRMPLEDDEEDEGEEEEDVEAGAEETMTTIVVGRTKGLAVTEDDIVESLLESEISE